MGLDVFSSRIPYLLVGACRYENAMRIQSFQRPLNIGESLPLRIFTSSTSVFSSSKHASSLVIYSKKLVKVFSGLYAMQCYRLYLSVFRCVEASLSRLAG